MRVVIGQAATDLSVPTGIHQELCENRIAGNIQSSRGEWAEVRGPSDIHRSDVIDKYVQHNTIEYGTLVCQTTIIYSLNFTGKAPAIAWTKLLPAAMGLGAKIANDGSIYITGTTLSSIDGQSNSGLADAFLVKFNSDGTKAWSRHVGGKFNDGSFGVSTANDGSIYITGSTRSSFDGQIGFGDEDAFITKFNSDGSKLWTRILGGTSYDGAREVSVAGDGSIYIVGSANSESFDGQSKNSNNASGYLTKFNSNGSIVWTKRLALHGPQDISISSDGSIHIVTYSRLTKFNSEGSQVWTILLGESHGGTADWMFDASGVSTFSDGSIYVTGNFHTGLDGQISNGMQDIFLTKFNSDGSKVWTRILGGSSNDHAYEISAAADGSVYIAGYTESKIFDTQINNGREDAFIAKFNSDGSRSWTKLMGGGSSDGGYDVSIASDGSIYFAGSTFSGNFESQSTYSEISAFLTKFNSDGTFGAAPTYTLTSSATTINEGAILATSVATTNVASGTTLYYALSGTGITTDDFSAGALTGSGIIGSDGSFSFSHTLANDLTTEGSETLNIKLFSDSSRSNQIGSTASVSIVDTGGSTTPITTSTTSVHRLFNSKSGVHLYSASNEEKDIILNNPAWGYKYEGVAYQSLPTGGTQLYRFYNADKNYHFNTANTSEALSIIKNSLGANYDLITGINQNPLPGSMGFKYEGRSFRVSDTITEQHSTTVYRFFNPQKSVHFYSSSLDEVNNVIGLSSGEQYKDNFVAAAGAPLLSGGLGYKFEGAAWYV